MGNLFSSLAVHHPRAFRDLQKEHACQADLLVGKNNVGETVTVHRQPDGVPKK
jgi:hypothetical protein